ncbi:MAG: phosphoglucosamine mutase [Promethearchaeota archaeon]
MVRTQKQLFGTNGIRGVANERITAEFCINIGSAIATHFEKGTIIVGCDGRTSNQMLKSAMISGITASGLDVIDIGLCPTPTLQYVIPYYGARGGVMITASHNPPQYNGIKVMADDGIEIPSDEEYNIETIYFDGKQYFAEWDKIGRVQTESKACDIYKEGIKKHIDAEITRKAKLKVVVDPANGVGGLVTPYVLRELGCSVITINGHIDGTFPGRLPEPTPKTLEMLSKMVKCVSADFGVAHDGDADRAVFIDEKGVIQPGDRTFGLVANRILSANPGSKVVTPVSSSSLIEDIVRKYDSEIVWTKVGSITVSRTILKENAILGGEENGGIFLTEHQPVRDGAMTAALIAEIVAQSNKSLSALLGELPQYYNEKLKTSCPNEKKAQVIQRILEKTKDSDQITIDGTKIFTEDGWVLIRPSGTEPLFRSFAEAKTQERATELAKWGISLVKDAQN